DYPNPWPKGYEEDRTWPPEWGEDFIESTSLENKRRRLWREETWPYPAKGAISTASCVSTREKALKFVQSLDQALKYLTNAATTLGVQEVRLNYMNDNIVTSHENTTAAESVIRDADMAKEMTNYSKYNVLSQSAQSMLAQANQNLGSSLDLLQ
ncbi:MAG: flagellin, partial [Anaerovibrio sp.]|nr:flagellin [Anaerovibrio sp.]